MNGAPNKVVLFVKKVYEMVNDASINDLISWHYDKKIPAFIVCKSIVISRSIYYFCFHF